MTRKVALITGITGQDGSYLAELLLSKNYEVHGLRRRSSQFNTSRIDHLYEDPHEDDVRLFLHYGDLTDSTNLIRIVQEVQPDEIYNLAAQSHVAVSFETPEYTANADALGPLRLLEAVRLLKLQDRVRFYQAATSELFGMSGSEMQNEGTAFYPRSPYGVAKLYSYWITVNYREAYGFFASNGILFNHESPNRGETFVTRKISRAAARMKMGLQKRLFLGNLDARRDWGHARDYVLAQWMILQHDKADDFVIASGEQHSVREFCEAVFGCLGVQLEWHGRGRDETGVIAAIEDPADFALPVGATVISIDPEYFRPTEVESLLGDARKARQTLNWNPRISFRELVIEMVQHDINCARQEVHSIAGGFAVQPPIE